MKYEQLEQAASEIQFWHSIDIPCEDGKVFTTKGLVDHCNPLLATNRFGLPDNLDGKTVLDIGCWDGYFSFLAEKRGAASVTGIDVLQGCSHQEQGTKGFEFAKKALSSKVKFHQLSLTDFAKNNTEPFDISLYYGVLYHVESPLVELKALSKVTSNYALIETAVSQSHNDSGVPLFGFHPNFDNDPTNFWYPNIAGLSSMLLHVGFAFVEVVYNDGIRATVKAVKSEKPQ